GADRHTEATSWLEGLQRLGGRPVDHGAVDAEPGPVTRAVPRALGVIELHHAAQVGAVGRHLVPQPVLVPVTGHGTGTHVVYPGLTVGQVGPVLPGADRPGQSLHQLGPGPHLVADHSRDHLGRDPARAHQVDLLGV